MAFCLGLNVNTSSSKVCILDVLQECGEQTVGEFQSQFGEENVTFIHCDTTNKENLKGTTGVWNASNSGFGRVWIYINDIHVFSYIFDVDIWFR